MARKRRPRGTGGLRYDAARGVWVGRVPTGRTGAGGRALYREVSDATQAGCLRKMQAVGPASDATTVAAWARAWLKTLGGRPRTREVYESNLRVHVLPAWGTLPLAAVKPSHVERLAVDMKAWGSGPNTIGLALKVARVLFNAAVREGTIPRNPVSVARKPRGVKKRIDPFTPDELRRIVAACDTPHLAAVALMASVGCRIGEALALDVGDFDGEAVSISRTVGRGGRLGPPKSANGVRVVRVPGPARALLASAIGGRPGGPLFGAERPKVNTVREAWYRLLGRLGLRLRSPHSLRHSVASHAIAVGVPIGNVARDLGDTPATITATYLHASEGACVADAMERLLKGGE